MPPLATGKPSRRLLLWVPLLLPPTASALRQAERADVRPGLIENTIPLHPVGIARYEDSQPELTWQDLEGRGRLGAQCNANKDAKGECGSELVCRQSICRHCIEDGECPSLHSCVSSTFAGTKGKFCQKNEAKAWTRAMTDPWEFLCSVAIFFASALAAAAGTGGGGMFVPLLVSFSALKPANAVPLSQSMILCGSIINISVFISGRHPKFRSMPVIDYDCIVLFEPMLCLGVMTGVMINQMSPQWLLLGLLLATLGFALWRTGKKGIAQLKAERHAEPLSVQVAAQGAALEKTPTMPLQRETSSLDGDALDNFVELTNKKAWQVVVIAFVWLLMFLGSFHGLAPCSSQFVFFFLALAALLMAITALTGRQLCAASVSPSVLLSDNKNPIDWMAGGGTAAYLHYPMVAFGAGFLGGLLGIGGGIIMGPVLVEVGMHSEAVQATSAMFVFLSSSLATIQFARLHQHVWHYSLWYGSITILATMVGQYLCDEYVRKRGYYSLITLAIAGVLLASLVALTLIGTMQVTEDIVLGRQMWFSAERFCNSAGGQIVAVDVLPATAWPADLPQ